VLLGALPLFHSFGERCAMNAGVATGSCLTLLSRFDGLSETSPVASFNHPDRRAGRGRSEPRSAAWR
jgi:hypothetical protein